MQLREFGGESPAKKALFSSVRDNNNDPASIIPAVICQLLVTSVLADGRTNWLFPRHG